MDVEEIRKWHGVFKREDELFEIRILGDYTYSGYFYDVEEAIRQLAPYDNFNIYYTINEVKKACASRDQFNCFRRVKGSATSKQDIEHRWWLPIDVDCERPSGVSSTDAEKSKAHKKAQDVFSFLRENGFSSPAVCDSSSGYHILYPIDMENNQDSEDVIKGFLEILANFFTDESVKIDTVLHDSNRILRVPGSFGRKGRSSEDRPHRLAKILSVPSQIVRMTYEQIKAFNDKYEIKIEPTQSRQYSNYNNKEEFNLRDFIRKYNIQIAKEVPLSGGGTKFVLAECPFESSHKAPDSALFEMPNGAIAFKCYHNSCSHYDWRAFRLHFDPQAYDHENRPYQPQAQQQRQYPQQKKEDKKPKYEIKEEIPELGEKWLSMSSIKKIDITQMEKVKTGFKELDARIGGMYMSEVTVLSGSNASGKSSWLNTLLLNVIEQGYKVALWSGELRADILKSWIQMAAAGKRNLRPSQFDSGRFYVPDSVGERIDSWLEGKFFLYNNVYGTKAEQILHDMEILAKAGVKVFILDNMMTLDVDLFGGDKLTQQKSLMLRIKDFAMKDQVHVIIVAHPRKTMAFLRKNDISGTGDIINIVDNCWIMHRTNEDFMHAITEYYNGARTSELRQYGNILCVEKNRLFGVVDYMCGMHYEIESRRFKCTQDENISYGWERSPEQTDMNFEPTPQHEIRNSVHEREYGGESKEIDDDMPFAPPPMDDAPF